MSGLVGVFWVAGMPQFRAQQKRKTVWVRLGLDQNWPKLATVEQEQVAWRETRKGSLRGSRGGGVPRRAAEKKKNEYKETEKIFALFLPSLGCFLMGGVLKRWDPQMSTFGLSGCRVKPGGPGEGGPGVGSPSEGGPGEGGPGEGSPGEVCPGGRSGGGQSKGGGPGEYGSEEGGPGDIKRTFVFFFF